MSQDTKKNHPNRAKPLLTGTPTPEEIKARREALGLNFERAGALVMHTGEQFEAMESGQRRMHPIVWWAFNRRAAEAERQTYDQWEATQAKEFSPASPEAYHAERAWNAALGEVAV